MDILAKELHPTEEDDWFFEEKDDDDYELNDYDEKARQQN